MLTKKFANQILAYEKSLPSYIYFIFFKLKPK